MRLVRNLIVATALAVVGVTALGQGEASAWSERVIAPSGDVRVDADSRPEGSLYVYAPAGEAVITGDIKGDLYCLAETVSIEASVDGSVSCAGINLSLDGSVSESARLVGSSIVINGIIEGDATTFVTNTVDIAEDAAIAGDLNGMASRLNIDGTVGGVFGAMDQIDINNTVGELNVTSQSISLGSSALIEGDVNYRLSGDSSINLDESKVDGTVTHHEDTAGDTGPLAMYLSGFTIALTIVGSIAIGTIAVFSRFFRGVRESTGDKLPIVLLVGFMSVFALPSVLMFLALTIIGLPLVMVVLVFWAAMIVAGIGYSIYALAMSLSKLNQKMVHLWFYILAVILVSLVAIAPVVGPVAILAALLYGSGSIVTTVFRSQFGSRGKSGGLGSAPDKKKPKTTTKKAEEKD